MEQNNLITSPKVSDDVLNSSGSIQPNTSINIKSESKQMSSSNSNEPKRVIKQIVSLDSKKLKALGIESNILSALTKFNGNEKSVTTNKPSLAVKCVQPSTPTSTKSLRSVETVVQQPQFNSTASISSVRKIVTAPSKSPETPPTKRIHVLSNVLLDKNKLDLKEFTAIASSTPINNTNIPYVRQVPKTDQTKSHPKIECDQIQQPTTTELSNLSAISDSVTESMKVEEPTPLNTQELDDLKGFSIDDLKYAQNQFELIQNELKSNQMQIQIQSIDNECEVQEQNQKREHKLCSKSHIDVNKTETKTDSKCESKTESDTLNDSTNSTTNATPDTILSSSDSPSDSESDLDYLIKEAQLTIANELNDNVECNTETIVTTKKPRLVQKELLDLLAEHVDKDRLIDDFLDSTINSFKTPCDLPSECNSSSDENDNKDSVDVRDSSDSEDTPATTGQETICIIVENEITEHNDASVPSAQNELGQSTNQVVEISELEIQPMDQPSEVFECNIQEGKFI